MFYPSETCRKKTGGPGLAGGYEAVRISFFKDVQAMAVGHSQTTPTKEMQGTGLAGPGTTAILPGDLRVVDFSDALAEDVADGGREFPAGVNLAVGKDGHKVKGCATAVPGTSSKGLHALLMAQDVNEIVFPTHDRIIFRCLDIGSQKRRIVFPRRELKVYPFPYHGKPIKSKVVGQIAE